MKPLLSLQNLCVQFQTPQGCLNVLDRVSFTLEMGQIKALVGESGSGKSVTALSILRLLAEQAQITSGEILFYDQGQVLNLATLPLDDLRKIRGKKIAMIFQEPMTSLNPVYKVGEQIIEAILQHSLMTKTQAVDKACHLMDRVGIPNPVLRYHSYPHELSGGMRQRIMIAMALSCDPQLLIADEPTTALDVTIQAQILELLQSLTQERDMSVLLITHDLGVVAHFATQVAVMYAGQIVEQASTLNLFKTPQHPYTKGLLDSLPSRQRADEKRLRAIAGGIPDLMMLPAGCRFAPRCSFVKSDCRERAVEITKVQSGEFRCLFPTEVT